MTSASDPRVETAWLRLLVRPVRDEATREALQRLIPATDSWSPVLRRIEYEGLVPHAGRLLRGIEHLLPEDIRLALANAERHHLARSLLCLGGLDAALKHLAPFHPITFKGPALAQLLYADPGGRSYGDLDLLVGREDRHRAAAALTQAGYTPLWLVPSGSASTLRHSCAVAFEAPGRPLIDLHWGLSTPLMRFELEHCGLRKRTRSLQVGSLTCTTFGPEDTLLHLCAHAAKDDWSFWSALADVAGLLQSEPELDLSLLRELAARTGTRRLLRVGLTLAATEAGAPLGPELEAWASGDATAGAIASDRRRALAEGEATSQAIRKRIGRTTRIRERVPDKLHALFGAVVRASEPRVDERWPVWTWPVRRPLRLLRELRTDDRPPLGGA